MLVNTGPGLLKDSDDVEGHHGESRAAVEDVERLSYQERFEKRSTGENLQLGLDLLHDGLVLVPSVLVGELLHLLLRVTVAPEQCQGLDSLLYLVPLGQPVRSLRDEAEAQEREEDRGDEDPGEGPPGDQHGEGEGQTEAQTEADVDHIAQTSPELLAGDLGDVDEDVGVHHAVPQSLHYHQLCEGQNTVRVSPVSPG